MGVATPRFWDGIMEPPKNIIISYSVQSGDFRNRKNVYVK